VRLANYGPTHAADESACFFVLFTGITPAGAVFHSPSPIASNASVQASAPCSPIMWALSLAGSVPVVMHFLLTCVTLCLTSVSLRLPWSQLHGIPCNLNLLNLPFKHTV
jgi:hypothetical protein